MNTSFSESQKFFESKKKKIFFSQSFTLIRKKEGRNDHQNILSSFLFKFSKLKAIFFSSYLESGSFHLSSFISFLVSIFSFFFSLPGSAFLIASFSFLFLFFSFLFLFLFSLFSTCFQTVPNQGFGGFSSLQDFNRIRATSCQKWVTTYIISTALAYFHPQFGERKVFPPKNRKKTTYLTGLFLATTKSTFIEGQTSYYLLQLTSDVSIQSINFNSISVQDNDYPINIFLLWNGTSNTLNGTYSSLEINSQTINGPNLISFSFNPSAALFNRASGSTISFTVLVNAQVTYKTTFGKRKKRDIVMESFNFERSAVLAASHPISSSSNSISSSNIVVPPQFQGQIIQEIKQVQSGNSNSNSNSMFSYLLFGMMIVTFMFISRRKIRTIFQK